MHTFNQRIDAANIRRETHDNKDWVIAPINILKPMVLNAPWSEDGAYLPEDEAKRSAPAWNGEPLTLGHPSTSDGHPTTANSPEMVEKTRIGKVYNATSTNEGIVEGEAWFDVDRIKDMGGLAEQALDTILNGGSVDVSSGYLADPINRNVNGHSNVQGNIRPDHVAVLPDDKGKCSVEHGCGVGKVAANNLVVTNMRVENQEVALTSVTPSDVSYTDSEWNGSSVVASLPNPSESEDAPDVLDATHLVHPTGEDARDDKSNWKLPFRDGANADVNTRALVAAKAALSGARGGVEGISESVTEDATSRINSFLEDAPDDMFGSMNEEHMSENAIGKVVNMLATLGWNSEVNEPAESGVENTQDNMSEKTQELVENYGFEADSLPDEDTECFETIYNKFTETDEEDESDMNENAVVFEDEAAFQERVEEIVAQRQAKSEKEQIADEIVANSEEYEEAGEVLDDFPTKAALQKAKKDVTQSAAVGNVRGANSQPATNSNEDGELKMFAGDY